MKEAGGGVREAHRPPPPPLERRGEKKTAENSYGIAGVSRAGGPATSIYSLLDMSLR